MTSTPQGLGNTPSDLPVFLPAEQIVLESGPEGTSGPADRRPLVGGILAALGVVLAILGSQLSWFGLELNGVATPDSTELDGISTVVMGNLPYLIAFLALVALLITAYAGTGRLNLGARLGAVAVALYALAGLVSVHRIFDAQLHSISQRYSGNQETVVPAGTGPQLVLHAGVYCAAGGILLLLAAAYFFGPGLDLGRRLRGAGQPDWDENETPRDIEVTLS